MKLYYQQFEGGVTNFGDCLNVWLWDQLIPDQLDDDERTAFVGIGTLLNDNLKRSTPNANRWVIFSSGVGYFDGPPLLRRTDHVYCVRGPLSAEAMGLDDSYAVTDGAALVRKVYKPSGIKKFKFAFMPHIEGIADEAWLSICDDLGFDYIDPRLPVEECLRRISEAEVLLAEAMHGAIVADALRVPWVPVVTTTNILSFKWSDWCGSIGLKFEPHWIAPMINRRKSGDVLQPLRTLRYQARRGLSMRDLRAVSRSAKPLLSSEVMIANRTDELEHRLAKFRADHAAGAFREMPVS
ncbi:MAG TPA: polysaccharide pyruvyl transferase family protein [Capsulimonadaceae bacterium]|jgi:succinoglycan biosynthesis protein ExoV